MSTAKKLKKYGNINIPAQSLAPLDKDGYLTKQGGSIKTWKRRYFALKGKSLYYYKTPKDTQFTGRIDLESTSLVKEETNKKNKSLISIQTSKRTFYMWPDRPEEIKGWIEAIARNIAAAKGDSSEPAPVYNSNNNNNNDFHTTKDTNQGSGAIRSDNTGYNASNGGSGGGNGGQQANTSNQFSSSPDMNGSNKPSGVVVPRSTGAGGEISPRVRLSLAKGVVSFLKDEESKVLEFWLIWSESIPPREELASGQAIEFYVSTSADMQKLTWKTNGPQNIFIQKMVDFFWNVGAPESEIDRLNDIGALINPTKIGSWIDMSAKGGMDGGWYFPVEIPLSCAVDASDDGDARRRFAEWAESHRISYVYAVGRDMGAAPPRQTELRLKLPGNSFEEQLRVGVDAFSNFGFPPIPEDVMKVIRGIRLENPVENGLCLSVITSSEGFVRLGLLVPKPSTDAVLELCTIANGNNDELGAFEASLGATGTDGPLYVECQYLTKGFGYGVYKEGFDIVFHYRVGVEELSE